MSKILDTRDLNERKEELESLRDAVETAREELEDIKAEAAEDEDTNSKLEAIAAAESALESAEADFGDDEQAELEELENLESEISEWRHGEAMIPESEFTDYIMEQLEDCGVLPKDLPWYVAIDRDETADNCKTDYIEVTYQGETYLVRAC